jgi:hypothetical protein
VRREPERGPCVGIFCVPCDVEPRRAVGASAKPPRNLHARNTHSALSDLIQGEGSSECGVLRRHIVANLRVCDFPVVGTKLPTWACRARALPATVLRRNVLIRFGVCRASSTRGNRDSEFTRSSIGAPQCTTPPSGREPVLVGKLRLCRNLHIYTDADLERGESVASPIQP